LPTRTLRTHRMDADLCIRDSNVRRDVQHQKIRVTDVYFDLEAGIK
jgi:hypothetical protein